MIAIITCLLSYSHYAYWDVHEKETVGVSQRVLARTVDEVGYYYRESTRLARRFGRKSSPHWREIYKYFSLSTRLFLLAAQTKGLLYISVSIYENIDDIYVGNDFQRRRCCGVLQVQRTSLFPREIISGQKIPAKALNQMYGFAVPVSVPYRTRLHKIYISVPPEVLYKTIDSHQRCRPSPSFLLLRPLRRTCFI